MARQIELASDARPEPVLAVCRSADVKPLFDAPFIHLPRLYQHSPGETSGARKKWAERRWHAIRKGDRQLAKCNGDSGDMEVHRQAAWHDGKTAGELVGWPAEIPATGNMPADWRQRDDRDNRRRLLIVRVLKRRRQLQGELRGKRNKEICCILMNEFADDLRVVGIKRLSTRTLYRWDGQKSHYDGRRVRGGGAAPLDPRVRDAYLQIALHANFENLGEAWRHARDTAEELGLPMRSPAWFRRWFAREYPNVFVRYCKNKRKFEADCLPKLKRDYSDIAPLEWISLDGRVLDVMCRVPAARHGWRRCRPVLTGVLDVRTRMLVGWDLRECETSDGILAGLKMMHRNFGCARHYHADNGEAYKASIGGRLRKKRKLLSDPRIDALCRETHAQRHTSIPYQAWAKMIESHWRTMKDRFDRYFWSFWGGSPDERPEGRDRETKLRLDQLPTLEEIREPFAAYLDRRHAEVIDGSGMFDLSPNLAMEQFRSEVRPIDPDVLEFPCSRVVGPRKVTRDGVVWNNVGYGQFDEDVWKLRGREVYLRIDPDQADFVWICNEAGKPLCRASAGQITGATQEEVREAMRIRARMRKIVKEYAPARDFLLETTPAQIMQRKAAHAQRREQAQRAQLPAAVEPAVTIVRPDLVAPVRQAKKRHAAATARTAAAERSSPRRTGFERLAQRAAEPDPSEISDLKSSSAARRFAQLNYDEPTEAAG